MNKPKDLVPIEYVCVQVGVSTQTLNVWYRWKQREPEQYAEFKHPLPDYYQEGNRGKRFWRERDIPKIIKFKEAVPKGRHGIFGNITQIGARKKKEERNAKKSSKRKRSKANE